DRRPDHRRRNLRSHSLQLPPTRAKGPITPQGGPLPDLNTHSASLRSEPIGAGPATRVAPLRPLRGDHDDRSARSRWPEYAPDVTSWRRRARMTSDETVARHHVVPHARRRARAGVMESTTS